MEGNTLRWIFCMVPLSYVEVQNNFKSLHIYPEYHIYVVHVEGVRDLQCKCEEQKNCIMCNEFFGRILCITF
jgi:hypothetical protein